MHFVKGVYPQHFGPKEWEFFNGQILGQGANASVPRWVPRDRQEAFANLAGTFPQLISQVQLDNDQVWAQFMESSQPEKEFAPQVIQRSTPFQRCILVKILRPDRLESGMQYFVSEAFGGSQVQPAGFALRSIYETESSPKEPILFIISPGSDPSSEL